MQATSTVYKTLLAAEANTDWKLVIDETTFSADAIFSGTITRDLMGSSEFGIGNVYVGEFEGTVRLPSTVTISRMAPVAVYCRLVDGDTASEWIQKGQFYINTRKQKGQQLTIACYDAMLLGDQSFVTDGEEITYPLAQTAAVTKITTAMGVTLDSRTVINSDYTMDYPNEMTMREVLAHIAVCHGGNWIITDTGTLRLVVLKDIDTPHDFDLECNFQDGDFDEVLELGRLTLYYEDGTAVTDGEDDGTQLGYDCYWATQDMTETVLASLQDAAFRGYTVEKACLDPALEPGDIITMDDEKYHLCNMVITMSGRYAPTITAPIDCAVESEYTYGDVGLANSITLGSTYEGVTITRADGLTIERTDGTAKVVLNSQEFTFYADGTKVLYFDPIGKKYTFVGDVTVQSGTININNRFTVDASGNVSITQGSINIDDNFIVDASGNVTTNGTATLHGGQLTASGDDEDTAVAVANDGLALFGSSGLLKAKLGFTTSGTNEYPFMLLGAGFDGSDDAGLCKKFTNGLWLGNSAPLDDTGYFSAKSGYNGLFFNFSESKAYVVNGTEMQNLYTGEAIAKFG